MNTAEAAERLDISKRTLIRWLNTGKVPDVKRDRNNYRIFDEDDLKTIRVYRDMETLPKEK